VAPDRDDADEGSTFVGGKTEGGFGHESEDDEEEFSFKKKRERADRFGDDSDDSSDKGKGKNKFFAPSLVGRKSKQVKGAPIITSRYDEMKFDDEDDDEEERKDQVASMYNKKKPINKVETSSTMFDGTLDKNWYAQDQIKS